ncbi:MAG: DUF167 domain-containing protein [Desulfobacterales bacterium]
MTICSLVSATLRKATRLWVGNQAAPQLWNVTMDLDPSEIEFVQPHPEGLVLKIFVLPRSSKNMLAGRHGDALKIKLTAPPVEGAANKMCLTFLAQHLGLPKSSLEIVSGHTGRTKLILVRPKTGKLDNLTMKDLKKRIETLSDG